MIEYLTNAKPYIHLNIGILLGSALLCLLAWLLGIGIQTIRRANSCIRLPHISRFPGSSFPTWADEIYTFCFIAFFAYLSLSNLFAAEVENPSLSAIWVNNVINAAIYLPFVLRYLSLPAARSPFFSQRLITVCVALVVVYAVPVCSHVLGFDTWLVEVTESPEKQEITEMMSRESQIGTLLALCFASVIMAPILEELAFRGFLYNVLRGRIGIWAAAVTSSLFFAAIHMSLVQTLPLFVFALAECYVYEKTQSIRFCIAMHMIFNGIASLCIILMPS